MQRVWFGVAGAVAIAALIGVFALRPDDATPEPTPTPVTPQARAAPAPPPAPTPTGEVLPGKIPMRTVAETIKKQEGTLRPCYEAELYDDPTLAGRWTISFDVTPFGAVQHIVIQGAPDVPRMHTCMTEAIAQWAFPHSDEGATVNRSFRFDPP